jgi:transcriptional regulator with GAF, ATPase, and Fis domain
MPYLAAPIQVPPLASREAELDRIIAEYAEDAIAELGTRRTGFLAIDRAWVREHAASSLPEIEKATLRLVAIRESRNLSNAAARLGMAPVSLSRWIGRRSLPMPVMP